MKELTNKKKVDKYTSLTPDIFLLTYAAAYKVV